MDAESRIRWRAAIDRRFVRAGSFDEHVDLHIGAGCFDRSQRQREGGRVIIYVDDEARAIQHAVLNRRRRPTALRACSPLARAIRFPRQLIKITDCRKDTETGKTPPGDWRGPLPRRPVHSGVRSSVCVAR